MSKNIWSKEEIALNSLEYGGFILYPDGIEWNDGKKRHFQVDFRKLFDAPAGFRDGLVYEVYKKLMEQKIPERYNLKIVGIPAAGTTITTLLNDLYEVPAARIRKEALVHLEDFKEYSGNVKSLCEEAKKLKQKKTLNPFRKLYNYLLAWDKESMAQEWCLLAKASLGRASANGRKSSRGKKSLFEEGSLNKGDALWLFDNVSSKNAKSKIMSCELIYDEAKSENLEKGENFMIQGSLVLVSNSPGAEKVHKEMGLEYVSLWTTPELIAQIKDAVDKKYADEKGAELSGNEAKFLEMYPLLVDELKELGWEHLEQYGIQA